MFCTVSSWQVVWIPEDSPERKENLEALGSIAEKLSQSAEQMEQKE